MIGQTDYRIGKNVTPLGFQTFTHKKYNWTAIRKENLFTRGASDLAWHGRPMWRRSISCWNTWFLLLDISCAKIVVSVMFIAWPVADLLVTLCNLRSCDLRLTLGCASLCSLIMGNINTYGWMLLVRRQLSLLHWPSQKLHIIRTERRAQVRPICSVFEQ
jgi:hypothetical protein